jgi:P-type Cu+ transporter
LQVGVVGISDGCKPEAFSTVAALKSLGLKVWMVTGDNETSAQVRPLFLQVK